MICRATALPLLHASFNRFGIRLCVLIVALNALMMFHVVLSWFNLLVLLCTNHTYTSTTATSKSLKHDCRCTAAVLLYTDFMTARTPRPHTWYILHTHAHTNAPCVAITKERSQDGYCCTVTATSSTESGGHDV